jgi:hypothetical protein
MARVVAFVPDLLFGSNVAAAVQAAGHEPVLAADVETVRRALPGSKLLIVDLTTEAAERISQVETLGSPGVRTLAFYSHVEGDVRAQAEEAGFDLVVPRSRMAREGATLIGRLLTPS